MFLVILSIHFHFLAERQQNSTTNNVKSKVTGENGTAHNSPEPTWVHEIFQVMYYKINFLKLFNASKTLTCGCANILYHMFQGLTLSVTLLI